MTQEQDRGASAVPAAKESAASADAASAVAKDASRGDEASGFEQRRARTRRWIAVGVTAAVLVVAGAGFWVWHEQPSFCNAICHTPMDPYVEGYYSQDPALLSAVHQGADVTCMGCHVPTLSEQLAEGAAWVTGGYDLPLEQRSFDDGFCLNKACHDTSREGLAAATQDRAYNPHEEYHGERLACGDCHKVHEPSVNACTQCHADADVPDNWEAYGSR